MLNVHPSPEKKALDELISLLEEQEKRNLIDQVNIEALLNKQGATHTNKMAGISTLNNK